jgi:hypothetical protein
MPRRLDTRVRGDQRIGDSGTAKHSWNFLNRSEIEKLVVKYVNVAMLNPSLFWRLRVRVRAGLPAAFCVGHKRVGLGTPP